MKTLNFLKGLLIRLAGILLFILGCVLTIPFAILGITFLIMKLPYYLFTGKNGLHFWKYFFEHSGFVMDYGFFMIYASEFPDYKEFRESWLKHSKQTMKEYLEFFGVLPRSIT